MNSFFSILVLLLIVLVVAFGVFNTFSSEEIIKIENIKAESKEKQIKLDSQRTTRETEIIEIIEETLNAQTDKLEDVKEADKSIKIHIQGETLIYDSIQTGDIYCGNIGQEKGNINREKLSKNKHGVKADERNRFHLIFSLLAKVITNQFIAGIASNYRLGKVVFNTPETMYFGNPEIIELKITDNLLEEVRIEEKGKIETESIDVYSSMKVELTGTGFDIEALTEASQIILENKIVTWRWLVTPNKLGKQKLYLNVYAIFQVGIDREPLNLNTFERVIKVRVNPRLTLIKNWFRLLLWIIPGGAITTFLSKRLIDYLKHKDWINLPF